MPKKPKFRPRITRIKLNPEQAVLAYNCYNTNRQYLGTSWIGPAIAQLMLICNIPGNRSLTGANYYGQCIPGNTGGAVSQNWQPGSSSS